MPPIDSGRYHQTDLVHKASFEEGSVDVPSAFEQQRENTEVFSKQVHRLHKVDPTLSRNNLKDTEYLEAWRGIRLELAR